MINTKPSILKKQNINNDKSDDFCRQNKCTLYIYILLTRAGETEFGVT